jgi:hypothetical protein
MISGVVRNANAALQHTHSSGDCTSEEGKKIGGHAQDFPG